MIISTTCAGVLMLDVDCYRRHVFRDSTEESGRLRRRISTSIFPTTIITPRARRRHGHWIGIGAERLGLQPGEVVTREAFLHLCDNQHPVTGEQLTPQHFRERRIYFDFVCSPPKSVSILAVTMNDQRIIEAHKEASTHRAPGTGTVRRHTDSQGRHSRNRTASPATWSARPSCIPRPAPLTRNCTRISSCSTATWDKQGEALEGAANGRYVRRHQLRHGSLSQRTGQAAASARLLRPGSTGSAFEIEGVEPKLIERFSKRSQQRDMAVKRQEAQARSQADQTGSRPCRPPVPAQKIEGRFR